MTNKIRRHNGYGVPYLIETHEDFRFAIEILEKEKYTLIEGSLPTNWALYSDHTYLRDGIILYVNSEYNRLSFDFPYLQREIVNSGFEVYNFQNLLSDYGYLSKRIIRRLPFPNLPNV